MSVSLTKTLTDDDHRAILWARNYRADVWRYFSPSERELYARLNYVKG